MRLETLGHTGGMDTRKMKVLAASLQAILDSFPDMMFVKDMDLTYVAGTKSFAAMVGKESMDEVLGRTDYELFEDKELSRHYTADDRKVLKSGRDLVDYIEPLTDENGEARYGSTSKYILTDEAGEPIGLLGISRDVTKEVKAKRRYQQEIDYLFTLPPDAYSAVFIDVDDWRIIGQRRQEIRENYIPFFESMEHFMDIAQNGNTERDSDTHAFYQALSQDALNRIHESGKTRHVLEYLRTMPDGGDYWVQDEWTFLPNPENGHLCAMLVIRDVGKQKQAEEALAHAAVRDGMTSLLNRTAASEEISEYLEDAGKSGTHFVFMIDADDFKTVNDTFGHQAGDSLLVMLAQGIRNCFRESDIVSRFGGDEFLVLAKNMPTQEAAKRRAEHLLSVVREIYATHTTVVGSVSIGISSYPADGKTLDELYARADEALYNAKRKGKNQAAFASEEQQLWNAGANSMRYELYNSQVVEHSNSICYISDMETYDLLHITKAGMELYGMTRPEEYLGKKCYQIIMGLDKPCPFCTNSKLTEGKEYRWEHYNENINKWFDRTSSIIMLDGRPCHLEIGRDITARKEELSVLSGKLTMEDILFRCLHTLTNEKDMDTAVNLFLEAVGGYYQADRAYILEIDWSSKTASCAFEWHSQICPPMRDAMRGTPMDGIRGWYEKFEAAGEHAVLDMAKESGISEELRQNMMLAGVRSALMVPLRRENEIVGILGVDNPRQKEGNLVLLRSVSEFVQAELERRRLIADLEYMSYTDTLTGLKNRNQYDRLLKEYERRTPGSLGVVYIDINGMKVINDTHGHSYGDHLIRRIGLLAAENLSGTVFRTGGDEFVALIEDISKVDFHREVVALRSAYELERECNVSIGSAWREQEEDAQSLLIQAGELLAADKQSYYHTVLREGRTVTAYTGFASEVAKEIEEGRFLVYYQPQVDIQTGKIIGAEALVRKRDENGGIIPPNKFIPFYEAEGVVGQVDMFVLRSACEAARLWTEQGYSLHLSVNFSRVTLLEPDIVARISGVCREHGVPTSAITIEVTESISKMDNDQLRELIQRINDAGFTISLDDFGSKYSNLAILATMDFDEIKFDKSLVDTLEKNPKSRVVMENTVKMCRDLQGTSSLAEGVETKGQLELLMDYQCDYGQGYYFSKPVPPEEFGVMLDQKLGGI